MSGVDGSVKSGLAASSEGGSREARLKSSYKTQVRAAGRLERLWPTGRPTPPAAPLGADCAARETWPKTSSG